MKLIMESHIINELLEIPFENFRPKHGITHSKYHFARDKNICPLTYKKVLLICVRHKSGNKKVVVWDHSSKSSVYHILKKLNALHVEIYYHNENLPVEHNPQEIKNKLKIRIN